MGSYKVQWKQDVLNDLKRISRQFIPQIMEAAAALADNPFPIKFRKLHGVENSYRIRVGSYRIIYQIDTDQKIVVIHHIRHRKDAYRK